MLPLPHPPQERRDSIIIQVGNRRLSDRFPVVTWLPPMNDPWYPAATHVGGLAELLISGTSVTTTLGAI
ncbi:MAG: hypothetical protein M3Y33_20900 [Actinomycetota bacterium]|nr:hypothetical protein [Actinomycetota bacterium]